MKKVAQLTIKSYTWNRESHGLFDYESKHAMKQTIRSEEPEGFIIRRGENVVFEANRFLAEKAVSSQQTAKPLAFIDKQEGGYILGKDAGLSGEAIWYVGRHSGDALNGNGYRLSVGDVIRLGRVEFQVSELVQETNTPTHNTDRVIQAQAISDGGFTNGTLSQQAIQANQPSFEETAQEPSCRICFSGQELGESPLISICGCSGGLKFIHLDCLKTWVQTKAISRTRENSKSVYIQVFQCEICKNPFPMQVRIGDTVHDVIDPPTSVPEVPHMTLVSLRQAGTQIQIHYIKLNGSGSVIGLGRGRNSDIRVHDISVSRNHAQIIVNERGVFLEDKDSKFGTLVKIQKPVVLDLG